MSRLYLSARLLTAVAHDRSTMPAPLKWTLGAESPLTGLGALARSCLDAGLHDAANPAARSDAPAEDWRDVLSEGLAPTALKLLGDTTREEHAPLSDLLARLTMIQEARSLAADAVIDRLVQILQPHGIRFVVIKGPAVARLYPAGWPRPYTDVDLLVEQRQFGLAMDLLLRHGFTYPATSLPPWPWFDAYCREGVNVFGAGNVDVHHHVAPWVFGEALHPIDVIERADQMTLGSSSVAVASREHSAVIAALHVLNDLWKGKRGLVSWRDLLVIVHQSGPQTVRAAFVESRLGWLFDLAMAALADHVPGSLEGVDYEGSAAPTRIGWRLKGLGWDGSSTLSRHRLAWAIRLPMAQAAAFALGSGLPSPNYIRARHGSYRSYWHQAWNETLSTFAGADHRSDKSVGASQSACDGGVE